MRSRSWRRARSRIHALDHHPEWSNVYSTVKVELVTHDAKGITAKDVELASVMEAIAERFPEGVTRRARRRGRGNSPPCPRYFAGVSNSTVWCSRREPVVEVAVAQRRPSNRDR